MAVPGQPVRVGNFTAAVVVEPPPGARAHGPQGLRGGLLPEAAKSLLRSTAHRTRRLHTMGLRRALCRALALAAASTAVLAVPAAAHDFKLGPLRIDHPYAIPTPPGATTGAAYLRGIRNTGEQADRLLGASTPVASRVEIHRSTVDAQNVMRMRPIDGVELPAGSEVRLRHGGGHHLMLIDLVSPLKNGERFPMTLRFERAGEREVVVWVQQPRDAVGAPEHRH